MTTEEQVAGTETRDVRHYEPEYCEYCQGSQDNVDVTYCEGGTFLCDKHIDEIAKERETVRAVVIYGEEVGVVKLLQLLHEAKAAIPFAEVEEHWVRAELESAYMNVEKALKLI